MNRFFNKKTLKSLTSFLCLFFVCYIVISYTYPVFSSDGEEEWQEIGGQLVTPTPTPSPSGSNWNNPESRKSFEMQLYLYTVYFFNEIGIQFTAADLNNAISDYCIIYQKNSIDVCDIDEFKFFINYLTQRGFFYGNDNGDIIFITNGIYPHGYHLIDDLWYYWNNGSDDDAIEPVTATTHYGKLYEFPFVDSTYHVENKLNGHFYFAQSIDDTTMAWVLDDTECYSSHSIFQQTNGIAFGYPSDTPNSWPRYGKIYESIYMNQSAAVNPLTVYVFYPFAGSEPYNKNHIFFCNASIVSGNLTLDPVSYKSGIYDTNARNLYPWIQTLSSRVSNTNYYYYNQFYYNGFQSEKFDTDARNLGNATSIMERHYSDYSLVYDFFWGNTLIISGTHLYLFWNGQWYDLGNNSDPFGVGVDFKPKTPRDLDGIIYNIFNQYNYYVSGNTVSGGSIDYSYDLRTIIDLLRSIDNRFYKFSIKFDEYTDSLLDKLDEINESILGISIGDSINNTINNTYNYFFIMTDEQKADINMQLENLKSPFAWIFTFIDGFTDFIDEFRTQSAAYSSGFSIGHTYTDYFTTSGNSASGISVNDINSGDPEIVGASPLVAPVLTAHFNDSSSDVFKVGDVVVLNLSWYIPYKPTIDKIVVTFCWVIFLWRLFKTIPSILSGGDGLIGNYETYATNRSKMELNDMRNF